MKGLAILLALVPALGAALVAWLLWFIWAFPWENSEPHTTSDRVEFGLLLGALAFAFLLEGFVIWFIARDQLRRAVVAFVLQAAFALGLLLWGLSESEHSDLKVFGFAAGCELCALVAVLMSLRSAAARDRPAAA